MPFLVPDPGAENWPSKLLIVIHDLDILKSVAQLFCSTALSLSLSDGL